MAFSSSPSIDFDEVFLFLLCNTALDIHASAKVTFVTSVQGAVCKKIKYTI